jgi:hypothetical protein
LDRRRLSADVTVTKTDNFGKTSPKPPFVDASVDARDTSLRVLSQQGPNFTLKTRIFRIFPEDEKIRCFVDVSSVKRVNRLFSEKPGILDHESDTLPVMTPSILLEKC